MCKWWQDRLARLRSSEPADHDEARRAAEITEARLEEIRRRGDEVSEVADQLREVKERNGFADLLAQAMAPKRRWRH
jgi:hypothetical protein